MNPMTLNAVLVRDSAAWYVADCFPDRKQAEKVGREIVNKARKRNEPKPWSFEIFECDCMDEANRESDRRTCEVFGTTPAWE